MTSRKAISGVAVSGGLSATGALTASGAVTSGGVLTDQGSEPYSDVAPPATLARAVSTYAGPVTPAAGRSSEWVDPDGRLWVRTAAGALIPLGDLDNPLTSFSGALTKPAGAASLNNDGTLLAPVTAGTVASADDTTGRWLSFTSAATSGSACGLLPNASAYTVTQRGWGSDLITRVRLSASAITTVRHWIGWASGSVDASATPAVHLAAFRYDTATDTTAYWRCVTAAGSATQTVTATTVAAAVDGAYRLRITMPPGGSSILFWINDVLVATHTANLPTATQAMGFVVRCVPLAAAARAIRLAGLRLIEAA